MRLLIAAEIFPPDIGGPATYSDVIGRELIAKNFDVQLVCYSDAPHDDSHYPFAVTRILRSKFKPLHYYRYYRALRRYAQDCDVIYAMGPMSSGSSAVRLAKKLGKKVVIKVVGDVAWERARNTDATSIGIDEFQSQKFLGRIGILQSTQRRVCKAADRVIVPSEYLKKIVQGWGVQENKISVVYNSADVVITESVKISSLIVSVGRLVSWKGFAVLIDVVADLIKQSVPVRLEIFGDGPQREKLQQKIQQNKLEESISIQSLPHHELIKRMAQAELFVLNTGYEGLSHTVLEAMACGVPIITTDVGGNPELITTNYNGVLVKYNNKQELFDAIKHLRGDTARQGLFIQRSKNEVLPKFTKERMVSDTIALLQNV